MKAIERAKQLLRSATPVEGSNNVYVIVKAYDLERVVEEGIKWGKCLNEIAFQTHDSANLCHRIATIILDYKPKGDTWPPKKKN